MTPRSMYHVALKVNFKAGMKSYKHRETAAIFSMPPAWKVRQGASSNRIVCPSDRPSVRNYVLLTKCNIWSFGDDTVTELGTAS